ncbi:MAG: EI24 domain-containing protein [Planctomycetota bacterium]|nr:EI24 domain-containing protein [Planctomycetota bacterium]
MMSTTEGLPLPDLRGDRCNGCGSPTAWEENSGLCPRCSTPAGKGPAPPLTPGLIRGAAAPFRGLRFLGKHPRLWAWVVIPLLLNTLLFAFAMVWTIKNLGEFMPDFEQEWPALFDWARVTLGWLLQVLLYIVGVLAAFLATLLLASVVNSPFYDLLSEKVEATKLGREDPGRPWSALPMDSLLSLKAALSIALRQALVMLVLFPLSFTAFGAPLFALAGFYYAGLAQIDVTLARKLYPGSRRTRWSRRHWGLVLGAGLPLSLLPLLAPFGIVGTTLAFLEEPDKQ